MGFSSPLLHHCSTTPSGTGKFVHPPQSHHGPYLADHGQKSQRSRGFDNQQRNRAIAIWQKIATRYEFDTNTSVISAFLLAFLAA
jgi:hypothetical protein